MLILRLLIKRIDFRGKYNAYHRALFGKGIPPFFYEEVMGEVGKAKVGRWIYMPQLCSIDE